MIYSFWPRCRFNGLPQTLGSDEKCSSTTLALVSIMQAFLVILPYLFTRTIIISHNNSIFHCMKILDLYEQRSSESHAFLTGTSPSFALSFTCFHVQLSYPITTPSFVVIHHLKHRSQISHVAQTYQPYLPITLPLTTSVHV